jgi:hypothetical protein
MNTKYKDKYRRLGVDFKPLVMEMHGAISETFLKFPQWGDFAGKKYRA